jgi:hypothetical protein
MQDKNLEQTEGRLCPSDNGLNASPWDCRCLLGTQEIEVNHCPLDYGTAPVTSLSWVTCIPHGPLRVFWVLSQACRAGPHPWLAERTEGCVFPGPAQTYWWEAWVSPAGASLSLKNQSTLDPCLWETAELFIFCPETSYSSWYMTSNQLFCILVFSFHFDKHYSYNY